MRSAEVRETGKFGPPSPAAAIVKAGQGAGPAVSSVLDQAGQRETADRLLAALRGEEFVLYAQPILPATRDAKDPPYQEILVRFLEEEEKLLPPGSFFPVLEEFRLMTLLDRWVVNRTIRWLRKQRTPAAAPRNAINLHVDTVLDVSFGSYIARQVEAGGVSGATLSFEVAWEVALAHLDRVRTLFDELRPLGCTFSLASYAGGAAAHLVLTALAPDFVKISGDVIVRMDRDARAAATVERICTHCGELGIRTIAQYIETARSLAMARKVGVDFVQGFLIGRPAPLV
ncbi:MAG: EAL domain-containing protein [Betaproteobacteria bacterium]|nr:EAL domain-containing protein [Betaproteobacteria bacterium]